MRRALMPMGACLLLALSASASGAQGWDNRPAAFSWTGCYIGANIGGGWADKDVSEVLQPRDSHGSSGIVGGGQAGCDYQVQSWVLGIQGMWDAADISGDGKDLANPALTWKSTNSWFATLTGRIGYAVQPQMMIYAKGGFAWVRDHNYLFSPFGGNQLTPDKTMTGWVAGAGVEYKLTSNWSVFAEYSYVGLNSETETFTRDSDFRTFPYKVENDAQMLLLGVNYRFGGAY